MANDNNDKKVITIKSLKASLEKAFKKYDSPKDGSFYVRQNGVWHDLRTIHVITAYTNKYTLLNEEGTEVGKTTIPDLVRMTQDGVVLDKYPIGTKIVIPYTDPIDGITYECPFVFATYQEFEKKTGQKFYGLGLLTEYGLPTDEIKFDAIEPTNPDPVMSTYGNSRYLVSNIRQWLNKEGKNWYTPMHEYDAPPADERGNKIFSDQHTGFLSCIPSDLVDSAIYVKNLTRSNQTGGSYDETFDKFFPLSLSQCNCLHTSISSTATEGRYWEYWRNKHSVADYWKSSSWSVGDFAGKDERKVFLISNTTSTTRSVLRTAAPSSFSDVHEIFFTGEITAGVNAYRVQPACVIG